MTNRGLIGMDNIRVGRFIAEKRKEKNLTQKTLAEKIGVTDKAVSKWERGLSCPDVSLLIPLSEELGVSITEILNGASIDKMEIRLSDDIVVSSVKQYEKHLNRKAKKIFIIIALICFLLITSFFMYGKEMEKRNHIDKDLTNLLYEIELSFDYGQEFLSSKNEEACKRLDISTSNDIRLVDRYRTVLYMYYGEDAWAVESEFDRLREAFLSIHHAVPENPHVETAHDEEIENGFSTVIQEMETLAAKLEELNVYYGSKELMDNILQNIKSKEIVN